MKLMGELEVLENWGEMRKLCRAANTRMKKKGKCGKRVQKDQADMNKLDWRRKRWKVLVCTKEMLCSPSYSGFWSGPSVTHARHNMCTYTWCHTRAQGIAHTA